MVVEGVLRPLISPPTEDANISTHVMKLLVAGWRSFPTVERSALFSNWDMIAALDLTKLSQPRDLRSLWLQNNQLTSLPESIGRFQNLESPCGRGGPMTSQPRATAREVIRLFPRALASSLVTRRVAGRTAWSSSGSTTLVLIWCQLHSVALVVCHCKVMLSWSLPCWLCYVVESELHGFRQGTK